MITTGSSLSPRTERTSWLSPSGLFAFGFYPQGDKYGIGIWLVDKPNNTVVWTANRDDPLVSSDATINFTKDGKLVVRTGLGDQEASLVGSELWEPATSASMLDSGNFVLYGDNSRVIIWESFDFPTNTILSGQNLSVGKELISSKSSLDLSSCQFRMSMQSDGNLVAYSVNCSNSAPDAYWSSGTLRQSILRLHLDSQGTLALWTFSGINEKILANHSSFSSKEGSTVHRATLDDDGTFRLYLHRFLKGDFSSSEVSIPWSAPEHQCDVKGLCGYNSYCRVSSDGAWCDCFPGFAFINESKRFLGCRRNSSYEQHCGVEDANITSSITPLPRVELGAHPYLILPLPIRKCKSSCLEDCNCDVAVHRDGLCSKMKLPIVYGKATGNVSSTVLVKILLPVPIASRTPLVPTKPKIVTEKNTIVLIVGVSLGPIAILCSLIAAFSFFLYRYRVHKYKRLSTDSTLGPAREFTLQSFSYKELEEATGGFTEEICKGSLGAVYKGTMSDGSKRVAVKRLERATERGEEEFQAEMAAIGHTHHKNIVQLLGFCMESSKKLLVFEYMENGSLSDLLFDVEKRPPWSERVRIALEVARGILYLHEECELQIIHCDITTQNILMDESRTAKISDFGLAKLLMPNQTGTKTEVRGTRGYVAPELQRSAMVSTKADIYSYGVVLLEIVCCRSNMVVDVSSADEVLLCSWVYNCYIAGELAKLVKDEQVDMKSVERMVQIGLLCMQDDSEIRPSIKDVILMLEGIMDVPRPPCPTPSSCSS
ncbi:G-type lectin S-receptor-like serine/threonine-protein kinase LECRK1 [Eucalyptus grandis]|uniref:G-type lectin S-receptor-like serine/threonine-protein kinase LECRK1 n=1 Tax=Eucalyptus grandis TaxID=71139 RepID=UPI00192EA582|nr:G-type lectin S-receptor-like serine/threonine-protein kinase LECRK1 [Eucalyptus grandis]